MGTNFSMKISSTSTLLAIVQCSTLLKGTAKCVALSLPALQLWVAVEAMSMHRKGVYNFTSSTNHKSHAAKPAIVHLPEGKIHTCSSCVTFNSGPHFTWAHSMQDTATSTLISSISIASDQSLLLLIATMFTGCTTVCSNQHLISLELNF